ncbi:MAG: TRAP transporter substrate-binding protein DctP [Candidatus Firestonebacteria bacterium]|nr:TRAP transporter substrate-binding protein DctP [Candidatus Firestonebacteria bacterium]
MIRLIVVLLTILICTSANALTIKLATLAPEQSPWYDVIRGMADDWSKATNGEVKIRIYAGGVVGDETDVVRKIGIGTLDAGSITAVGMSDICSEIQAMQMPMMIQSYEELDFILSKVRNKLETSLDKKGYKVLNWGDVGWVKFFTQKKVIFPDDMKDQTMFVWGGDTGVLDAWKEAGFKVMPLAITDMLTSLQTKKINAFSTSPIAAASFQWFALAPNMSDLKWAALIGGTVISKKSWNKIPEKYRPELEKIAAKRGEDMKLKIRALEGEAVKIMVKNGLKVHEIPESAVKDWTEKARGAYVKILTTPELKAMYEEINKYHLEYLDLKKK